ncbi:hypothetical protein CC78DRAFT_535595 [Lojkania enalia]|uniref:Uncharacterized protein n=1 Tax=Lojkania enalia TaxID=147567 RepID=A0A9P4N449_9PLEO|nr:hypothetical protein CC78DRAFT_535595 [Didymosphaeria enalia]
MRRRLDIHWGPVRAAAVDLASTLHLGYAWALRVVVGVDCSRRRSMRVGGVLFPTAHYSLLVAHFSERRIQ